MGNTFDPDLQHTMSSLLRPKSKAERAIEQAHATIAARQKAAQVKLERHPQVTQVAGRVVSVDFGKR